MNPEWIPLLLIGVGLIFFFIGHRFGKMSGHIRGFEQGVHFERQIQAKLRELSKPSKSEVSGASKS